jgi:hypothetical protein
VELTFGKKHDWQAMHHMTDHGVEWSPGRCTQSVHAFELQGLSLAVGAEVPTLPGRFRWATLQCRHHRPQISQPENNSYTTGPLLPAHNHDCPKSRIDGATPRYAMLDQDLFRSAARNDACTIEGN